MKPEIFQTETTESITLNKGDVAVILTAGHSGEAIIRHNIESISQTGEMDANNGDMVGMIMALTFIELLNGDEPAFMAAMKRVVGKLGGLQLRAM